jgi:hypothetical protein
MRIEIVDDDQIASICHPAIKNERGAIGVRE